jgi:cardiolipin synthase
LDAETMSTPPQGAKNQVRKRRGLWRAWLIVGLAPSLLVSCFSIAGHGEKEIRYELTHRFAVEDPQFLRSMGQLLGPAIVPGNRVTALQNGDQTFPAMLGAIGGAQESITFETYIYWSGDIGQKFSDALCERAQAGVKVHVMLDWLGTGKIDAKYLVAMKAAGVEVERYHPIHWYDWSRVNNRTHRKLLVVDGRIGFTGGIGIADAWEGDGSAKDHWRDSHYKIEGPAVAQMQAAFGDNWIKARAKVLFGHAYYPELTQIGRSRAQVFKSSPSEGSESVRLMYLLSIASATKRIRLQAAYFVPDDLAVATLVDACKRGVKIEIIVPGPQTDSEIVQGASRSRWAALLDAGVLIYEYQPSLYHCKVLIVDDVWVSVGSTNFDNRSFRLNDEANLNIYDAVFAAEQAAVFELDVSVSRLMTAQDFKNRSRAGKMFDAVVGLLRQQL